MWFLRNAAPGDYPREIAERRMSPNLTERAALHYKNAQKAMGEKTINRILSLLRWTALAVILLFLIYKLTKIGWVNIYESRPTSAWFYLLSIAMFMVLPLTDKVNYRTLTGYHIPEALKVFSRKQVFNEAVVSYAGETYLCPKLAALPEYNTRKALIAIKDNTLISGHLSEMHTYSTTPAHANLPCVLSYRMQYPLVHNLFCISAKRYYLGPCFFRNKNSPRRF